MRILRNFLLSAALAPAAFSQEIDWAEVHRTTVRGIDRLYNLEFDSAEAAFDSVLMLAPSDPRGHFFKGMVHYWVYLLTTDKQSFDRFFERSERVIEICEDLLDRNDNDGMAKFYLGGIYGYRGLVYQRSGSLLSAVWDGRKGYRYLEEAATRHQGIYDAQLGFGLFKYLVARVPPSFRWILNLLGFSGDREGGLASLKLAADSGLYARSEAAFFYAQFSWFEDREDEAMTYLQRLMNAHPGNTLFLVTLASWEFRRGNLRAAMDAAERAIAINTQKGIPYGDEFAHAVISGFYFAQNAYRDAVFHAEEAIKKTEDPETIFNSTYYRLGLSHELLGDRAKAVEFYRKAREADLQNNPWQYQYWRLARQRLRKALDSIDVLLIRAGNALSLRQFDVAVRLSRRVADLDPRSDRHLLALYQMSGAYFEQKDFPKTVEILGTLFQMTVREEIWVRPHAHLRMGIALAKMGRTEEAGIHLDAVRNYKDYEFQDRIEGLAAEERAKLESSNGLKVN